MLRLVLKLALAAGAVAALWSFVPIHGRTLGDRWRAAGGLEEFVERGWAEARAAARPAPRPQARTQKPAARPSERHSEADRRAVERLLSERLAPAR